MLRSKNTRVPLTALALALLTIGLAVGPTSAAPRRTIEKPRASLVGPFTEACFAVHPVLGAAVVLFSEPEGPNYISWARIKAMYRDGNSPPPPKD